MDATRRRLTRLLAPMRPSPCASVAVNERRQVQVQWHVPGSSVEDMTAEQLAALSADPAAPPLRVPLQQREQCEQEQNCQRRRLMKLGACASIEVSPVQAGAPPRPSNPARPVPKPLAFTVASAMDDFADGRLQRPPLTPGTCVFVNMVKTNQAHFQDVAVAVDALSSRGLLPVPHLPACRFESTGAVAPVLRQLRDAGSKHALMLLGGNDQQERFEAGAPYSGADALLESGAVSATATGVEWLMLAGHPEGHPGLAFDKCKTAELLEHKVFMAVVKQGYRNIAIVSQLCFDPETLLHWLDTTRTQLKELIATIESLELLDTSHTPPGVRLRYYVGVPGPTAAGRLQRVAQICEVSSPTVAKLLQGDGSGAVGNSPLTKCKKRGGEAKRDAEEEIWPEKLVYAVAAYCSMDHGHSNPRATFKQGTAYRSGHLNTWDDIRLHVFPFGGLAKALEMIRQLADGSWPHVVEERSCGY